MWTGVHPGASIAVTTCGTVGAYLSSRGQFLTCAHVADGVCRFHPATTLPLDVTRLRVLGRSVWPRCWAASAESDPDRRVYGSVNVTVGSPRRKIPFGVDAALCDVAGCGWDDDPRIPVDPDNDGAGFYEINWKPIKLGDGEVKAGDLVVKHGAATGVRYGRIQSVSNAMRHSPRFDGENILQPAHPGCVCETRPSCAAAPLFLHQYQIRGHNTSKTKPTIVFADLGDSGSMVFCVKPDELRPLALLHAVEKETGYGWATPIEAVMTALDIDTLC